MTSMALAVTFLLLSFLFFSAGELFRILRIPLISGGFFFLIIGISSFYANTLPQTRVDVSPPPLDLNLAQLELLPPEKIGELGAKLIFDNPETMKGAGKAACPFCHSFKSGESNKRAPNLFGITKIAIERIREFRYLHSNTIVMESFSGSGRATTSDEYIAESFICPSCYVVEGYGLYRNRRHTTDDRESAMPRIHMPPIELTIEELVAVHTFLYINDGNVPPSPRKIAADYEKFIQFSDRHYS